MLSDIVVAVSSSEEPCENNEHHYANVNIEGKKTIVGRRNKHLTGTYATYSYSSDTYTVFQHTDNGSL